MLFLSSFLNAKRQRNSKDTTEYFVFFFLLVRWSMFDQNNFSDSFILKYLQRKKIVHLMWILLICFKQQFVARYVFHYAKCCLFFSLVHRWESTERYLTVSEAKKTIRFWFSVLKVSNKSKQSIVLFSLVLLYGLRISMNYMKIRDDLKW